MRLKMIKLKLMYYELNSTGVKTNYIVCVKKQIIIVCVILISLILCIF